MDWDDGQWGDVVTVDEVEVEGAAGGFEFVRDVLTVVVQGRRRR